jgi:hypothetical protein
MSLDHSISKFGGSKIKLKLSELYPIKMSISVERTEISLENEEDNFEE